MKIKRIGIVLGILVLIGLVLAWVIRQPGPMAFATGKRVALAAYDGKPTGVPADLPTRTRWPRVAISPSLRTARPATPGRGLRLRAAVRDGVRHDLFAEHNAGC
jgi:hypothetical protein